VPSPPRLTSRALQLSRAEPDYTKVSPGRLSMSAAELDAIHDEAAKIRVAQRERNRRLGRKGGGSRKDGLVGHIRPLDTPERLAAHVDLRRDRALYGEDAVAYLEGSGAKGKARARKG